MAGKMPTTTTPEGDYAAVETAVMETARGRWFLAEFARRNRSADTEAVLDAIARLESATEPSVPIELIQQIDELRQYVATLRGGSGDDARPAHARPVQAAENAMAAIRRTTDKIREVSFELRETARLGIYAEALDLYCHDLTSAVGFQETATRQLTDLATLLGSIETRVIALADATTEVGAEDDAPVAAPAAAKPAKVDVAVASPGPAALPRAEEAPAPLAMTVAVSPNGHSEKRAEPAPVAVPAPAPQPAAAVAVGGSGRAFLFVRPG